MRITFNFYLAGVLLLASPLGAQKTSAQDTNKRLYNAVDHHFQNFTAEGPRLSDALTMMHGHICRATLIGLAVTVAHKFLTLPEPACAQVDPLMGAFNLKDARAGAYIKKIVYLYLGVWSGFGEIHFKKQAFSEKIAGGPPSLYSPSFDPIFDVIGEMGAVAVVRCDHDTPYNLFT